MTFPTTGLKQGLSLRSSNLKIVWFPFIRHFAPFNFNRYPSTLCYNSSVFNSKIFFTSRRIMGRKWQTSTEFGMNAKQSLSHFLFFLFLFLNCRFVVFTSHFECNLRDIFDGTIPVHKMFAVVAIIDRMCSDLLRNVLSTAARIGD